jgi:transcriptional regulator with XRE-family HTH domain
VVEAHGRVAFLPFGSITLKSLKAPSYEEDPESLGEHLRRRRLQLGLIQKEVAASLGVTEWGYANWEKGRHTPSTSHYGKVVEFLGYYPHPAPRTWGQRLRKVRRCFSLSHREAARAIGVDQDTVLKWESGAWEPTIRTRSRLEAFLERHEPLVGGDVPNAELRSKQG